MSNRFIHLSIVFICSTTISRKVLKKFRALHTTPSDMCRHSLFGKNLQRFRLVTFDITDTLLRFRLKPYLQYKKTAQELGFNVNENALTQCFAKCFKHMTKTYPNFGKSSNMDWQTWWTLLVADIFRCADSTINSQQLKIISNRLLDVYRTPECWQHIEGGQKLIELVRAEGKKIGVISNFDPSLRNVLSQMDLDVFDFVLTSYECGAQKPNNRIFEMALAASNENIEPHQALHIGNTHELDYVGARASGWSSLLIDSNKNKIKDHQFNSLLELVDHLETKEMQW